MVTQYSFMCKANSFLFFCFVQHILFMLFGIASMLFNSFYH